MWKAEVCFCSVFHWDVTVRPGVEPLSFQQSPVGHVSVSIDAYAVHVAPQLGLLLTTMHLWHGDLRAFPGLRQKKQRYWGHIKEEKCCEYMATGWCSVQAHSCQTDAKSLQVVPGQSVTMKKQRSTPECPLNQTCVCFVCLILFPTVLTYLEPGLTIVLHLGMSFCLRVSAHSGWQLACVKPRIHRR